MWVNIDRHSDLTLERQIYLQIRKMILSGGLAANDKLPSTRKLSAELAVSRNTVIEAYSQLIAEGYLKTFQGSGTVVAEGLHAPDILPSVAQSFPLRQKAKPPPQCIIDFRTGVPALAYFPHKEWGNLYREICHTIPPSAYGYCGTAGLWELREAISKYLYRTRGLSCDPHQIVITTGATQGLSLVSRLLKDENKKALVEDPTHAGLRKVITSAGCAIEGVPADENGLCTEALKDKADVSFIYTTPSHQYPLGGVLPIGRRLELMRYAQQHDCYIVEDDYDSEFRYEGQPVSALYELAPQQVIYLGSFSKVLAPALRLGFMILPEKLLHPCKVLKQYSDVHTDVLSQYTLAKFIQSGGFEKHIWKMKKLYSRKRSQLIAELSRCFPDQFSILGHATGLHFVVRFTDITFAEALEKSLREKGVRIYRPENYYLDKRLSHSNEMIMGYSHLSYEEMVKGVAVISEHMPFTQRQ